MRTVKWLIIIILILGGLVLIINQAFLYSSDTTHPYLTEQIVKFYNYYYDPDITSQQLEQLEKGSIHEDFGDRSWFYHFYDPIYNTGSGGLTAKQWAQNPEKQASFPGGDHSWQTAINEYNSGYKQKSFYSLGHILHLIEDMAVPAHTRNDFHYNGGDPLENWAGDLPKDSALYNIAQPLISQGIKPKTLNNLDTYFDNTAIFSNKNFFSKDSVNDTINVKTGQVLQKPRYSGPKIVKEGWENGQKYGYGKVDGISKLIRLVRIREDKIGKLYFIKDDYTNEDSPEIHADYFSILSKEAVINGAGVIKLFFDSIREPEKEINEPEKQLSFLQKIGNGISGAVKFVISVVDGLAHIPLSAIDPAIEEVMPPSEYLVTGPGMLFVNNLEEQLTTLTPEAPPEISEDIPEETYEVEPRKVVEEEAVQEFFFVKRVIDGDTIVLENGKEIRYIGIDTPELPNGCFSQEATNKNKELVEGKKVRLEKDVSEADIYGRLLRYVYIDSLSINDYLVRNGYAYDFSYEPDIQYKTQFSGAEEEAKENRRGLWGDICHPIIVQGPKTGGDGGTSSAILEATNSGAATSGQEQQNQSLEQQQEDEQPEQLPEEQPEPQDITPPEPPAINSYTDNQVVSGSADFDLESEGIQINFLGTAEANSTIIIEQSLVYLASTSEEGNWSQVVTLNEGENNFKITAKDQAGNESQEISLVIHLDLTPPETSISISDYNDASSSFDVYWSSPEASVSFNVEYKEGQGDPPDGEAGWQILLENTIETQTNFVVNNKDTIYYFRVKGKNLAGNESSWKESSIKVISRPVVINEIALILTNNSLQAEWIELYNRADYDVDLTGWSLKSNDNSPEIIFVSGDGGNKKTINNIISAKGYYLLERTNDATTSKPADWYGSFGSNALNYHGEILELKDGHGNQIDLLDNWYAGDYQQRKTMERINPDISGTNYKNWKTYIGSGSATTDAGGNPIFGTPKAKNSVYKIYTAIYGQIVKDTTWTLENSPYLIYDNNGNPYELLEIAKGKTLTIEPGVIVKFINPGLKVHGTIKAEGTTDNSIIFTNYNDDYYGGDIFRGEDNSQFCSSQFCQENPKDSECSKCPKAGSWSGIWITGSLTDSVFDNVVVRYAGSRTRPFRTGSDYSFPGVAVGAGIRVENTSIILKNSTIENNLFAGVLLTNSPNTIIEKSTFQNHLEYDNSYTTSISPREFRNRALYIDSSNPKVKDSAFQNNLMGIFIENNSGPIIENNIFYNNSRPIWVRNSYPQFSNNQIEGNQWDGIVLTDLKLNQDYTLGGGLASPASPVGGPAGGSVFLNYDYPYDSIVVPKGYILTIEPGTIIKSVDSTSGLKIEGTLIAEGTAEKKIVFTSFYDDEYGGDTNGDGDKVEYCRTKDPDDNTYLNCPKAGSWGQIVFTPTSTNSILNYVVIRYGGTKWGGVDGNRPDYVLKIEGSSLSLMNSIIENNTSGFRMENSSSHIANTTFQDHHYSGTSTGLYLSSSRPIMDISTFLNNSLGVYIDPSSWLNLIGLVFTNNNKDFYDPVQ